MNSFILTSSGNLLCPKLLSRVALSRESQKILHLRASCRYSSVGCADKRSTYSNDDHRKFPFTSFQQKVKLTYTRSKSAQQTFILPTVKYYSTSKKLYKDEKENNHTEIQQEEEKESLILYEGPFASLAKRLKRISITSAIVSIIGIPLLITFHSGDVPMSGQAAVGSTAIIAATGSTVALSFCFGPYVNEMSYVKNKKDGEEEKDVNSKLIQIKTTNIFGMEKITTFNPEIDVSPAPPNNRRPFCNFMVRDEPFYIHPELLGNDALRVQLLGEEKIQELENNDKKSKKDLDDDGFI